MYCNTQILTLPHFYSKQHRLLSNTAKNIENEVLNFFRYCNPNSVDNEAVHFVLCGVKLTEVYFIKITGEDSGVSGYENSTTI